MMDSSTESALHFVRALAEVAERLASRSIVVRRLDCDWGSFGSWLIEASAGAAEVKRVAAIKSRRFQEAGPEVYRATWDGKDRQLLRAFTPTTVTVMLNQWHHLESESFQNSEAAIKLAEQWLSAQLGQ
ncbi:MAG: hypothetical protein JSS29_19420 [Proteobacteria bacterium]|nr:hypothetical protein [Pseudomonadota bacterium]